MHSQRLKAWASVRHKSNIRPDSNEVHGQRFVLLIGNLNGMRPLTNDPFTEPTRLYTKDAARTTSCDYREVITLAIP